MGEFKMKEVLSIPAGKTIDNIKNYGIHAFPYPRIPNYEASQYITFRAQKGGEMEMLYSIVNQVVLNPSDDNLETQLHHLDHDSKDRIIRYIQARKTTKFGFEKKGHTYMFYVLKEVQALPHKPRPQGRNTAGHTYYTYEEITCGKVEVVIQSRLQKS